MDPRESRYISARAMDYFDKLCAADSPESVMKLHKQLCDVINVKPTNYPDFFPKVMAVLTSAEAQELLKKYEKRVSHKCYENGKVCAGNKVLIIGAGPCGLRTAIEAQFLGSKVVVIEKRNSFSRNNVLHLWPFVIADLKALGAKKFYGKFCPGAIDHISICQLQMILLKVALILGVEVHFGVEFHDVVEPNMENGRKVGWRAELKPEKHPLCDYEFDVLIGADGRRNTLKGFKRKALRAKLAIAITANFINKRTAAEAKVQEISGVSFIFKQGFFNELCEATGIDLENIVYYKDETHYFVMTAKKHSLLWKGVLHDDYTETEQLLAPNNINREALKDYIIEAVNFATGNKLPNLTFALNSRGEPDIALIDFTEMYQAENACRVVQRKCQSLLVGLVGDSLLEPFWPTGSGCARGFLSSLDMCWTIRSWAKKPKSPTEVIAERESIYRLLAQATHENLSKDYNGYTVEPHTRYPYINLGAVKPFQVKNLLESDEGPQDESIVRAAEKNPNSLPNKVGSVKGTNGKVQPTKVAVAKEHEQEENEFPDMDEMLGWFRNQVQPYGVKVDGIQDVYVNGDVLCAIIHRFRPDLLPEFPLPPEVQQGDDDIEMAAFRNQLAFDFLRGEYSLISDVSGLEATKNFSTSLSKLLDYTIKVYNAFKYLKPFSIVKPQINISPAQEQPCHTSQPYSLEHSRAKSEPGDSKVAREMQGNGYISCVWTSSTNFINEPQNRGDNEEDEDDWNRTARQVKRSNSIQRMVQRLDGNAQARRPRSLCFQNQDDSDDDEQTYFASSNEIRRKRMEEADKSKVETLKLVHMLQSNKKEIRDEERAKEREMFIRTVRSQQQNEPTPETSTSNYKTVNTDEFFNEYNMRLWRKSKPSMDDRTKFLETKLFNSGLERNASFCVTPKRLELTVHQTKPGLFRSATEKNLKGEPLPASVQSLRRTNTNDNTISQEITKDHSHVARGGKGNPVKPRESTAKETFKSNIQPLRKTNKNADSISRELTKGHGQVTLNTARNQAKTQEILTLKPQQTSVQPLRKANKVANQISKELAKGHGHISLSTIVGKKESQNQKKAEDPTGTSSKTATSLIKSNSMKQTSLCSQSAGDKGLIRSPTTANIITNQTESLKKKNDFSEYFKARDLAKSKSAIFKHMKVDNEPPVMNAVIKPRPTNTGSIIMQAKKNVESESKASVSKFHSPSKTSNVNPTEPSPIQDRSSYQMKNQSTPPLVARQTTLDEFDDLLSEADEVLADLDPEELEHLAKWTETTFSTARGVELN